MFELVHLVNANCGGYYGFFRAYNEVASDERMQLSMNHGSLFVGCRPGPLYALP
ncbi:Uncharacterised protein [Mycobacteroides abscessus subsp. bolletii]|nr:Uncharacterised protein [Mycobacteroides abscessus subsp. bolletii]